MGSELERLQALAMSSGALMDPDFLRRVVADTNEPHAQPQTLGASRRWRGIALGVSLASSIGSIVTGLLMRHPPAS